MGLANGMHHCAFLVNDMKNAMHFLSDVCGMKLKAFYWMHGVEKAYHAFFELNEHSSFAVAFNPAYNDNKPANRGQFGSGATPGNFEHFAFNVATEDDLLAMNDRLREKGYQTFGPIDHGMFKSIYVPYAINNGTTFEFSTDTNGFGDGDWIDPDTYTHAGFTAEDIARWRDPESAESKGGTLPNPEWNSDLQPGMAPEETGLLSNPEMLAMMVAGMAESGDFNKK